MRCFEERILGIILGRRVVQARHIILPVENVRVYSTERCRSGRTGLTRNQFTSTTISTPCADSS